MSRPSNGVSSSDRALVCPAPAKLNIRLKITGRRPDGYHNLVSVMVPVTLYDRIELRPAPGSGIFLTCCGLEVPEDEENLAVQAAKAFLFRTGLDKGLSIHLTKNIPVAAGLGGGSSDAAAVLRGLNRMEASPLAPADLEDLALELGADVPFFLHAVPCIARGIGERLTPIETWPDLWYVIVMPPVQVSTAWVYGQLAWPPPELGTRGITEIELTMVEYQRIINYLQKEPIEIIPLLENDLERVTLAHVPEVADIKKALLRTGAMGTLMSGSGPSVFGIYPSEEAAKRSRNRLGRQNLGSVFLAQGLG
ncbi:MAG: 4-(cytidine 5'-diphospho)-2-C-methyl-D-erythritol kinase [Deltaproteobacteria bacterium]|nr:4-(cytidine 5'-diphospho)-2-C-methyl-D-erythritol kinase [Deltaproteobacteria bacterium]